MFLLEFQKSGPRISQMCRTAQIQSALQSADPGGSNGGLHVEIWALGADLIEFEIAELSKKREFLSTFLPIPNPISGQPHHFKNFKYEVGLNGLDFDDWPTVRCAKIRSLQRTLNQSRVTSQAFYIEGKVNFFHFLENRVSTSPTQLRIFHVFFASFWLWEPLKNF